MERAIPDEHPRPSSDPVNHPSHYTSHASGIEAADFCEHFSYNFGSALAYIWRSSLKDDRRQDLDKALWFLERESALMDWINTVDTATNHLVIQPGTEALCRFLLGRIVKDETDHHALLVECAGEMRMMEVRRWLEVVTDIVTNEVETLKAGGAK